MPAQHKAMFGCSEIGVSILSAESTVPTCCLSQTSAGTTNVSVHPAELLLSLLLQAIFSPHWICPSHRPLEA